MPIEDKGIIWDDKDIKWDEPKKEEKPERSLLHEAGEFISAHKRPVLQAIGGAVGGALALPANFVAPGVAEATGIGLGTLAGTQLANALENKKPNLKEEVPEAAIQGMASPLLGGTTQTLKGAKPLTETAEKGLLGQGISKIAEGISKGVGWTGKQVFGKLTGAGTEAIGEAVQSGKKGVVDDFAKAMRGEISGDEVVANAKDALNTLKANRATAYQESLSKISTEKSINMSPIIAKTKNLMKQYNVKLDAEGKIDLSRVAMGKTGRNDIEDIINILSEWGTKKGDRTPIGLDTLKRQLDDFYSDSSEARHFVASLRSTVRDTISNQVPEYNKMTKGYEDATKLIKDIEAGLMMRKQGMTGRIVADQTLNRLIKVMKSENDPMRKELIDILAKTGGKDLTGQIAGYNMKTLLPGGIQGGTMGIEAIMSMLHPSMLPVLAASSPRVVGEFVRAFGMGLGTLEKTAVPGAGKAITKGVGFAAGEAVNQYDRKKGETLKEWALRLHKTLKGDNAKTQ